MTSLARGGAKRIRHRILPALAAGDEPKRRTQIVGRIIDHRLREGDDDLVDVAMCE
jgi:hypothetical protein